MSASRRGLLALSAVMPLGAMAAPHPDAELIRLCANHEAALAASDASNGSLDEDDEGWMVYCRSRDAIDAARPQTIDGMVAKARAAKVEARTPDGREEPDGCPAENWAWDLVNDLIRLHRAAP